MNPNSDAVLSSCGRDDHLHHGHGRRDCPSVLPEAHGEVVTLVLELLQAQVQRNVHGNVTKVSRDMCLVCVVMPPFFISLDLLHRRRIRISNDRGSTDLSKTLSVLFGVRGDISNLFNSCAVD